LCSIIKPAEALTAARTCFASSSSSNRTLRARGRANVRVGVSTLESDVSRSPQGEKYESAGDEAVTEESVGEEGGRGKRLRAGGVKGVKAEGAAMLERVTD
jgi:hypothetical protein